MSRDFRVFAHTLVLVQFCWHATFAAAGTQNNSVAQICESAAQVASSETGVPLDVLRSISLTETGRKSRGAFQPWPWTVNMEGVGKWFETLDDAQHYVDRHFQRGARSFDVGCFQINYRWHGQHFTSVQAMFDPMTNARYAASFLSDLFEELGNWSLAAGAYHSRTPKYASKYRARFDRIRANLSPHLAHTPLTAPGPNFEPPKRRQNKFPFLQLSGGSASSASLVRLERSGIRLIDLQGTRALTDQ